MQWFANLLNPDFIHSKSQNVEFVILNLMATTNLHHQKEETAQHQFSFFSFFFLCRFVETRLVKIKSLTKYLVLFVLMLLFYTFKFFYQLNQPAALGELDLAFLRQSRISVLVLFMLKVGGFAWLIFTGNLWEWNQSCWGLGSTVLHTSDYWK